MLKNIQEIVPQKRLIQTEDSYKYKQKTDVNRS